MELPAAIIFILFITIDYCQISITPPPPPPPINIDDADYYDLCATIRFAAFPRRIYFPFFATPRRQRAMPSSPLLHYYLFILLMIYFPDDGIILYYYYERGETWIFHPLQVFTNDFPFVSIFHQFS